MSTYKLPINKETMQLVTDSCFRTRDTMLHKEYEAYERHRERFRNQGMSETSIDRQLRSLKIDVDKMEAYKLSLSVTQVTPSVTQVTPSVTQVTPSVTQVTPSVTQVTPSVTKSRTEISKEYRMRQKQLKQLIGESR